MAPTMVALILSLALSGAAGLSGTVVDATGGVIPGAAVVVLDAAHRPTSQKTVTNARGEFVLDAAAPPVEIEVTLAGFSVRRVMVNASPATIVLEVAPEAMQVIDVSARQPERWRDGTTGATTLTRTDLDRVPAMTPDESLKVISGFSLFRRSSSRASNPTTHGVTMRGLSASGASRALVVFNGVPLNDGFGGWITWERLPSAAIDQVTVQRGPMSDVFGSDALGGAITLMSPAVRRPSGTALLEAASLDTRSVAASGGGASGRAAIFGAASWFDTAGFIPLEAATRGPADVATDTTWTNVYGRATFGAARRLTLGGWGGRDDRGNGTVVQRNASHGGTGTAAFETTTGQTQLAARLSSSVNRYEQTFSALLTVAGVSRASERLTSTQHIDTDVTRGIVEVRRSVPKGVAAIRASFTQTNSDFEDIQTASTVAKTLVDDNQSLSAQFAIAPVSAVTLSAGGRVEWRKAGNATSPVALDPASVGRIAAAWRISNVVTARAAAGSSHRWPTLNELVRNFSAGTVTTVANTDLAPERARSIEAGLDAAKGHFQVSVTGFRSIVRDAIANVTTSVVGSAITRQRQNAGEAHSAGVELDASADSKWIRVRGSATVLNARFRNSREAALEGNWLPQVPRLSLAGTADVFLPRGHVASLVVHRVSTQFDDDRNTAAFKLADATQIDARVGGTVRMAGWYVAIENLSDARLETGRSGSTTLPLVTLAQGRAVRVGVSLRLPR
ncbi:MAG: TonB-dependent receptor [Acidobacteria bacterium]|nr:MAG: TonB-dependent receptor [Acidobacteriota bacterium]